MMKFCQVVSTYLLHVYLTFAHLYKRVKGLNLSKSILSLSLSLSLSLFLSLSLSLFVMHRANNSLDLEVYLYCLIRQTKNLIYVMSHYF